MEEKIFTINIRKRIIGVPRWKRSLRAIRVVKDYLKKHMKSDNVKIGKMMNDTIWERSMQKPPAKIRIKAIKTDEGVVKAELLGYVFPEELTQKKEEKKEKPKEEKKPEKKDEKKNSAK